MQDLLIVDGYNMVNAWPELVKLKNENFEHARERLLDIMANYQGLTGKIVIVVFDAHMVKRGTGSKENHLGVEVIFTQSGETADACIERLVSSLPGGYHVTVATSDWAQQRLVMGLGALRMSARELLGKVEELDTESRSIAKKYQSNTPLLDGRVSEDIRNTLEKWRRGK